MSTLEDFGVVKVEKYQPEGDRIGTYDTTRLALDAAAQEVGTQHLKGVYVTCDLVTLTDGRVAVYRRVVG